MKVKDYKKIIKITPEEKETIKENSPYTLPLNPTAQGFSGAEIRRKLYQAIVGEKGSVLELLDKLVNTTTTELNSLATAIKEELELRPYKVEFEEFETIVNTEKLDKDFTSLPNQATPSLTDVMVLNRGTTAQKTTLGALLALVGGTNNLVDALCWRGTCEAVPSEAATDALTWR